MAQVFRRSANAIAKGSIVGAVALIAADELESLSETAHLLRSPANAERLLAALVRARAGEGKPQSVDELRRELGLS